MTATGGEPAVEELTMTTGLSTTDGTGDKTRGLMARAWRGWWRPWVMLGGHLLLSIGALAYLAITLVTTVTMVFAPGRYLGRVVFPLGRTMAAGSLRMSVWLLGRSPAIRFPKAPRGRNAGETLVAVLRSRATWRAYAWLLMSIPALVLHILAVGLFPLASLWGPVWAKAAVGMLGRAGRPGGPHRRRPVSPSALVDDYARVPVSQTEAEPADTAESAAARFGGRRICGQGVSGPRTAPMGLAGTAEPDAAPCASDGPDPVPHEHRPRTVGTQRTVTARARRSTLGTGYGLAGMRERVTAVGGSLEAGPTPDGGFAIRAVLPVGMQWTEPTTPLEETA
ncbi:MAG: hypothetical protein LBK59_05275 [Bifidobacteriaceae bacterium]|nr:hypothetical protein [Bifidobacteriaceae bacterium]